MDEEKAGRHKKSYTGEEIAAIRWHLSQGASVCEVAKFVGRSEAAIREKLFRLAVDEPWARKYMRRRAFVPDEDRYLLEAYHDGVTLRAMSDALGRTDTSVKARISRLLSHNSESEGEGEDEGEGEGEDEGEGECEGEGEDEGEDECGGEGSLTCRYCRGVYSGDYCTCTGAQLQQFYVLCVSPDVERLIAILLRS